MTIRRAISFKSQVHPIEKGVSETILWTFISEHNLLEIIDFYYLIDFNHNSEVEENQIPFTLNSIKFIGKKYELPFPKTSGAHLSCYLLSHS